MNSGQELTLKDRLQAAGLDYSACTTFADRQRHSINRVEELRSLLLPIGALKEYPRLAIYAAGSHARGDASVHSDIDLWFMRASTDPNEVVDKPQIKTIGVMSTVLGAMEAMAFPLPSNDGEYLKILSLWEILRELGGRQDDYRNHFTARMLLILESVPIFGMPEYEILLGEVIDSYMRDYEDHAKDFRPTFLVNDILRYWKTLCLNYEHRRNKPDDARKIKQKIKNFKLGYSRLLTCLATVAVLSSFNNVTKSQLIDICKMSPIERLLSLFDQHFAVRKSILSALVSYHWFLEKTELSTPELESYFSAKQNREIAFSRAKEFGGHIFDVVKIVAEEAGTLRYLVV